MSMRTSLLIVDNFYLDPDKVRETALNAEFSVSGNYPGMRTKSFLNQPIKDMIQLLIEPHGGKITDWGGEYTGAFQYVTAKDRSWIHSDATTDWAGVCYLTPNAPVTAGTGIFRHKETGLMSWKYREHTDEENKKALSNRQTQDYTKWELVDRIGNLYNRIVLYRGDLYHVSMDYFGENLQDGRLFQTFFFNTER